MLKRTRLTRRTRFLQGKGDIELAPNVLDAERSKTYVINPAREDLPPLGGGMRVPFLIWGLGGAPLSLNLTPERMHGKADRLTVRSEPIVFANSRKGS